jgi:type II secretory pathway component PulF
MPDDTTNRPGRKDRRPLPFEADMLFSRQLSLSSLIELCRALRHNLSAGLSLVQVFRQQADRGPLAVRPIARNITDMLAGGDSLEAALANERRHFPPILLTLAEVGEQTGTLPEVFAELEKYFALQQRLRRQFWVQSFWPIFQLFAGIFVVTLMLLVLGALGSDFAPLGSRFRGVGGAFLFLTLALGSIAGIVALYYLATRGLGQAAFVHALLLRLPVLGPCLEAVALARFCLCVHLTMETSLALPKALRLCLRATGNAYFASKADAVSDYIRGGDDLSEALSRTGLFPYEFLGIMATAEEAGRVPEAMRQQADYYSEEAERRLRAVTAAASVLVWLIVAAFLIFLIFSIFTRAYLAPIQDLLKT